MKFATGNCYATPGAIDAVERAGVDFVTLLSRHVRGDWGNLCEEDRRSNEVAVLSGARIMSAYDLPGGSRVWFLTEADRSVTTMLLPSEY